jgi:hypothetical protein
MRETESPEMALGRPSETTTKLGDCAAFASKLTYPVALLASISIWFLAIRAPLWLDETLSYWQASGGFGKVWTRSALMPSSIGYLYTLWFAKSILGTSELALKIPSTLALLAAVYFLFRVARELFGQEIAYLTCIFFSLESNVGFASTDARPYAFALLATAVASLAFVHWMNGREMRQAVRFGAATAGILYFHYLFAAVVPVFAIYYLLARWRSVKEDARQLVALLASCTLFSLPLIYRVASLYHTRQNHIVQEMRHPGLVVLNTLVPQQTLIGFVIVAFLAALLRKIRLPRREEFPAILFGPLLALVPAGILIAISAFTSAHLLIPRYLTVAAPGSAFFWALLTSRIESKWLRQVFCVGLVAVTVFEFCASPKARQHELSFKPVHAFVNTITTPDELPVLVCSAFIESNYEPLPSDRAAENALISQVYYYPIQAPVLMLPMTLNEETVRIASHAVLQAAQRRQRFLAIGAPDSYKTLEWLASYAGSAFAPQIIGTFNDIVVVEFRPISVN